ncbi:hypothetical protein BSL78_22757 [Apostichopus japonicus]|uniref:THAP-type domain-containing protein n=1 Tax=Stichopus japonicus TaxID=307972 RepID=A0A2G8JXE0_STIJA|nr:hypothetical protein BSL78_22757 [Apostichopus japonicus]
MLVKIVMVLENLRGSDFVISDGITDPEKRELSQKWLHQIATGHTVDNFTFHKYKVVCEDHFELNLEKTSNPAPSNHFPPSSPERPRSSTAPSEKISETAKDQPPSEERTLCQPLHCSPKGVSTLFDPPAEVLCPAVTPTTDVTRITQQFLPDALSRVCASTQTDKTDVTEMRCQAGIAEIKTHYACTVELDQPYSMLSADVSSEGMAPPQETPLQQETLPPQRSLE